MVMVLCSLYLVIAPFADNPLESTYCLIFILSGVPFYFCFVKYQILPDSVLKKYGIYKLFQVQYEYESFNERYIHVSREKIILLKFFNGFDLSLDIQV